MRLQRKAVWKIFEVLGSTQVTCKGMLTAGENRDEDLVVIAKSQTNGLTRQPNTEWVHHKGNVAMSLGLRINCTDDNRKHLPLLQMSACLSVIRAVAQQQTTALIKWPNDIYMDEKKLGGILSELIVDNGGKVSILCGIGINIERPNGSDGRNSNFSFLAGNVERDALTHTIYKELRHEADQFEGPPMDYFKTIEKEYNQSLLWRNQRVDIFDREKKERIRLTGKLMGLNRYGGVDIEEMPGCVESVRELVSMRVSSLE